MKAAVIYESGGSENIKIEERPLPLIKDGWVLVKVKAFGINRSELMTRKGYSPNVKFPRVLGIECVGEVEQDPSGELKPGQKVAAFMGGMGRDFDGSYAEYALLPKQILYSFESHMSWKELGAIPEMFQTVFGSLHLALKIKIGETLLVRGGTSSIGMLATQLAKNSDLQVIATTRKSEKIQLLLNNGANHVIIDDGNLADKIKGIYPNGIDKVLELVGTSTLKDSLQCTAPGGSVCMTGMLAEQWALTDFSPMEFIPATVNLTVYDSGQIRVNQQDFQQFIKAVEAGKVHLTISNSFPFKGLVDAHRFMESNSGAGKIVVLV